MQSRRREGGVQLGLTERYRTNNRECFAFFISAGRAFFLNSKQLGVLLAGYG